MRRLCLCVLIASLISCKSTPLLKSYGVITSEVDSIPTIDTSNNVVRPIVLAVRQYHLTNNSTNHNINFICKAYLKGDGKALTVKTEKHIVLPKETIQLNIDSDDYYNVIKYEIIDAHNVQK